MKFKRLILKNFLTYKSLDYHFPDSPIRVQGENLTDDNQKSNGTGKSAMQTAIEFACTATNSRGVRDSELVNYDYKEAEVDLYIECRVRKETLLIRWLIKKSGSNVLELSTQKFGEEEYLPVSFSNVNDGKKWISDWIHIEKEDLFNYYLINKERFKSFFKSSDKDKIALINRFSDASIIEGLEDLDIDSLQRELDIYEDDLLICNTRIESKLESIELEEARDFKKEKVEQLKEIQDEIDDRLEEIQDEKVKITEATEELKVLNTSLSTTNLLFTQSEEAYNTFKTTNFKEERKEFVQAIAVEEVKVEEVKGQKKQKNATILKAGQMYSNLSSQLLDSITCPKCAHKFSLQDKDFDWESTSDKKEQVKLLKESVEGEVVKLTENLSKLDSRIEEIEVKMRSINQKETKELALYREAKEKMDSAKDEVDNLVRLVQSVQVQIDSSEESIQEYQTSITRFKAEKKAFKVESNKEVISGYKQDITDLKTEKTRLAEEILKKGDQIYEVNQWKVNFKRFKMFIANKSLKVIEFHCNRYLEEMRTDMRLRIDGFRELASGEIKESITPTIIRAGERSFNSLSGGEKGRVLFASILANKHMIDSTHPYGGLDFLSIDEIFEGVDQVGLKYLMKSVKDFTFPIMVITHVSDEDTRTGEVLTIIKENGESRIK